ncbi:HutD family protein [Crenobacter sp. SG2305]|uniref:HutD/Ves family protein n=1 Tax=Crenobacter oryzisoli TaxID=3056844 RepID=UPI0025AB2D91|nr:HutD family protein [Crenobacter sp. SG2305]MDN0084077.1 HutD family protein [Crenobacter sp. SG2305]
MQSLCPADYRQQPWKNGAGTTVELAVFPADAGLDSFDWRISRARVGAAGPFSAFPGIDRSLALLSGAGLRLTGDGFVPLTLKADGSVWRFTGETPVAAELINDDAVEDFNVMTRRGRFAHRVAHHALAAGETLPLASDGDAIRFVHCFAGRLNVGNEVLAAAESLLLAPTDGMVMLQAEADCRLFIVILIAQGIAQGDLA